MSNIPMKRLIVGEGNEAFEVMDAHAIHFDGPQDLTPEQQAQARDNIGAVAAEFGKEHAGKLLYVDTNGNVAPLSLGAGLAIVDGVLTIDSGIVDVGALLSSDGYVLKDSNGLYVKAKEEM